MAGKRSRIPKYGTVEIKGHTYYRTTITDIQRLQGQKNFVSMS